MLKAEPLNLALGATSLLPPITGIGRYTQALVRGLETQGHHVDLFYGGHWADAADEAQTRVPLAGSRWTPKRIANGVKLRLEIAARRTLKAVLPNPRDFSRKLQQRQFTRGLPTPKPHLYHEPNYLAWQFDGPTVISAHDISWIRYPQAHPGERLHVMDTYFPESLARADAVLVGAQFVRDELIEHFNVAPERLHVTPYGVSESFRPCTPQELAQWLPAHQLTERGYFLAVGTLEPRKNLITVIRAHARLAPSVRDRYPLVLVGTRGWLNEELDAEIARAAEGGRIRWLGYVEEAALPALTAGALATVYPSLYEGFGFPPLESMACGTPVLASDRASIPEVVGDAGLLCEALDVDAFSAGMTRLIEDHAWRNDLAVRGLARAKTFTWAATAAATEQVYRKVLAGRR